MPQEAGETLNAPSAPTRQPVRDVVDYDLLFDCVHCGLCLEACPTYLVTRAEPDSPRGRIYLMKALAEGTVELRSDTVRHLDLCLGCRGCETACPSGVHYGRLIEKARDYVGRKHWRSIPQALRRHAISAIFPYPDRLRRVLAPLRFAERAGLRPALRYVLPRSLGELIDLLPPLDKGAQAASAAAKPPDSAGAADGRPSVVVHHGCVAQVLADSENRNSERWLESVGYRVVRMGQTVCCGALDLHSGNLKRARKFARMNVQALKQSGADRIISAAAGCSTAMAEYGELLKDDPKFAEDAREVSAKVSDMSSLILERATPSGEPFPCTVTYHDACHMAHGLGVRDAPRKLLSSISGVRLVEMAESDLCCGSAGSYNLTEPRMARELARRKAENIIATDADYVVLSNPGCGFQIAAELRRRGAKTRVVHLADFLALASSTG